jgi:hypothetical protein
LATAPNAIDSSAPGFNGFCSRWLAILSHLPWLQMCLHIATVSCSDCWSISIDAFFFSTILALSHYVTIYYSLSFRVWFQWWPKFDNESVVETGTLKGKKERDRVKVIYSVKFHRTSKETQTADSGNYLKMGFMKKDSEGYQIKQCLICHEMFSN